MKRTQAKCSLAVSFVACGLSLLCSSCSGPPAVGPTRLDVVVGASAIDVAGLAPNAVTAYVLGDADAFDAADLVPMMSSGQGYNEKWELILYSKPYETRIKFEVSNLGLTNFNGRVSGRVKLREDGEDLAVYDFDEKFSQARWRHDRETFRIEMGDFRIEGAPGAFRVRGVAGKNKAVTFDYVVEGEPWRPGTGVVLFGNDLQTYFKTHLLIAQGRCVGEVVVDGATVAVEGDAYGNHFATNLGAHELADQLFQFRKSDEALFVEWRHFVTPEAFAGQAFGFLVVYYDGVPLFETSAVEVTPLAYWTDPENYGYVLPHGLRLVAQEGDDRLELWLEGGEVSAKNALASLPAMQRSIAERFARPVDYNVKGRWRLLLRVEGEEAQVDGEGSYAVTIMR